MKTFTGKAEKMFEAWFDKNKDNIFDSNKLKFGHYSIWDMLGCSMQWGVYLEFADSLDINIIVDFEVGYMSSNNIMITDKFIYNVWHKQGEKWTETEELKFNTRQEAQESALERLNEIINEDER